MTDPEGRPATPHELVNPEGLPPPLGFSHAVVPTSGRLVFLAGQAGHDADGRLPGHGIVAQFEGACANVVRALEAAGGRPEHLVSVQIFVTDAATYRSALGELGDIWRRHLGRHYPAVSLFQVAGLFDPAAKVELVCVAVVPEP
ncbi:MAG: RidA family protein [Actinobacteria bacterium]|nr:RidA family protein [Actinomycetota bacterium]